MFGLNFVQSGFLLAGLAAAIPIVIHLLLKQQSRRLDIGSVRFLEKVLKEHNAMRRIREWLLLAARIVTALLLALLFSRPFFDRTSIEAGQREVIFLLDRSASTQLQKDGESVFQKSYDALQDEIAQVHDETIVRLAAFDSSGVQEIDWRDGTHAPEPSFAGTDYGKAIRWARDALQQSSRQEREIILFSDLQRSGLGITTVEDFPADIQFQLRDFGQSISSNRSIDRAEAVAVEIRPKMPPKVEVDVHNGGPVPLDGQELTLELQTPEGQRLRQNRSLDIAGNATATAVFEITAATEGMYTGVVKLAGSDELALDNTRYIAFQARRPDRILVVDGEEGSNVYGDETYYLQTALQVGEATSSRNVPSFEIERIVWENGQGFPDLAGFRAIVLANVGSFSSADADRLGEYLAAGGRIAIFCGDKFTRRAARPLVDAGVLPVEVEGVGNLGPYRIASWAKEHPILRPFEDPQYGDLRRLQFAQIALLTPVLNSANKSTECVALATSSRGHMLCAESFVGRGKVLIWASTADTDWGGWPQSRLYVPMVRQVVSYLTDHHERENRIDEIVASTKPGISFDSEQTIVANVAPQESDLTRVGAEEFRQEMNLPEKGEFHDLSPEELAALAPPAGSERPGELWRWIAWILFGWLILETFLAGQVHA